MKPLTRDIGADLTRRFFLTASAGLFMPRWMWAEDQQTPLLYWKLEEHGDSALECVSASEDPITSRTGHAIWVGEGGDRALRLDGYSVWVSHAAKQLQLEDGTLTISAWLALESYPVNEAAILQLGNHPEAEVYLSIDKWGYLHSGARQGNLSNDCKSARPIPKAKWIHVATVHGESSTTLYIDGSLAGQAPAPNSQNRLTNYNDATLGRTTDCPVVAEIFPTGVLNGLLCDVRIFNDPQSPRMISDLVYDSRPDVKPDLQINGPWCADDPQRPIYHALPPRAWTNEPHGLIHWGGQYHIFYQKNPNGPYWGHINWGHMTSPNLYRWTEMPVAIWPEPGPDEVGCWSGSVIHHEGKLTLIYTGGGSHASICLAESTDGIRFTKHSGNPIIPAPPQGLNYPEFRDPFVWREGDIYYLIIGSAVKDVGGTALLYRSKDLITWEYRKPLLVGDRETSGVFWEMPIFVNLGNAYALIVCEVPGRASYWVGSWKDETFIPFTTAPHRLDLFNHLLSPTPLIDEQGQVITMGIIPDERSSKECWKAGWAHLYSLPRVLAADASGRIIQKPLEGIDRWCEQIAAISSLALSEGSANVLEDITGVSIHLHVALKRGESGSVSVFLRRAPDGREQTEIRYEWEIGRMTLDRSRSSLDPEVKCNVEQTIYFPPTDNFIEMDIFLDHSVIEVFVDNRAAFAARIYPTLSTSEGVGFGCRGSGAIAQNITVARVNKPA
jgi:sucrose-6-phosphate hydrolase SacC (GH32 family)